MSKIIYKDDTENIGLPKWPAMFINGNNVTVRQAAEIILRTDASFPDFIYAGNDRDVGKQFSSVCGIGDINDERTYRYKRNVLKVLDLQYMHNNQIISSYMCGPHGWVSLDGRIFSNSTNIGKWPSVSEVAGELKQIIDAFPFLKFKVVLHSGETSEVDSVPIVRFNVYEGNVVVRLPDESDHNLIQAPNFINALAMILSHRESEVGIPLDSFKGMVKDVYGDSFMTLDEYLKTPEADVDDNIDG
jgi:hypothetical protein